MRSWALSSVGRAVRLAATAGRAPFAAAANDSPAAAAEWARLQREGARVNPCNSRFHPAAKAGVAKAEAAGEPLSVQAAYDPLGMCFACGARRAASRMLPRCALTNP